MNSISNKIKIVTAITLIQFVLMAISALVLRFFRNYIDAGFIQVTYCIPLFVFIISAMIFLAGILLFDVVYLRILIESRSKRIWFILYYCVIYAFRLYLTIIIIFGVFDFYLINSDYGLSENLQHLCFYYFPLISPIVISAILLVKNRAESYRISR